MLLDTCIIIDLLKNKPEAISLFKSLSAKPSVSAVTVAEIFAGIRNSAEKEEFEFLLQFLSVRDITFEIGLQAGILKKKYFPSHHTDLIDALIVATAMDHKLEFKTLNCKHFPMIHNLKKAY